MARWVGTLGRRCAIVLMAMGVVTMFHVATPRAEDDLPRVPTSSALKEALVKLHQEWHDLEQQASKEWQAAADAARTEEDWQRVGKLGKIDPKERERVAASALKLAKSDIKSAEAFEALKWVVTLHPTSTAAYGAAELAVKHHIPASFELAPSFIGRPTPWSEQFLKGVASGVQAPNRKAPAQLLVAFHAQSKVQLHDELTHASSESLRRLGENHGPEYLKSLRNIDIGTLESEAVRLFEELAAEHGAVKVSDQRIRDHAEASIFALKHLRLGKRAPDIEGLDTANKPLKLSDYRGKVVLLVFWASWCAPCVADISHERELVAKLHGEPFAIVGVNVDQDTEQGRRVMEQERVTWQSFADTKETISRRWLARSLPTAYVLDQNHVIRAKGTDVLALTKLVEELVEKAPETKM